MKIGRKIEMTKQEILEAIAKHPVFYLGTVEGNQPRVRGMLIYKVDEEGIVFHTAKIRELYSQVCANSLAELCFNADGVQIRISGKLEEIDDNDLKDEIANHPTRKFLDPWRNSITNEEFHQQFVVYKLAHGTATLWTMAKNMEPKEVVQL